MMKFGEIEAMASQGKAVDKEMLPSQQASVDEQADDLLNHFKQYCQVSPTRESGKSGSFKSRATSPYHAKFQAPLQPNCMPKFQPQWQEIDDIYRRMREIMHMSMYMDGDRLSPEDEMAVRDVLKYHQKSVEKTGPGIDYIKIQQINDHGTRCFWVVRVDGTEIDFSYHKCLKEKAAKECPDLLEHYDALYKGYKPKLANRRDVAYNRFRSIF